MSESKENYEACKKMCINQETNLILYSDQQKILISDFKRETNKFILSGTREDGVIVCTELRIEDGQLAQTTIEDLDNFFTTFATQCSPIGEKELATYSR